MTTFATPDISCRLAELDARTRGAWTAYRDELIGLEGSRYGETEPVAWELLQATLREVEVERAELASPDRH